jgi:hypothetical protein
MPANLQVGSNNEEAGLLSGVQVFEPMTDAVLYPAHNQMAFYTWGDANCCLPKGATEATLAGPYPNLQPGDVLIFQEMKGPQTGDPADADIRHRCAVRLSQVAGLTDPLNIDKGGNAMQVTEIQWSQDDALPFPICISSSFLDSNGNLLTVSDVSVAFGNVVLTDHGLSLSNIKLGQVPEPRIFLPPDPAANRCNPALPTPVPERFRPQVPDSPVTQAVPLPVVSAADPIMSAHELMSFDPSEAVPAITLTGTLNATTTPWTPVQDLLESGELDTVFVMELEWNSTATIRFSSDNVNGKAPDSGTYFVANYRIGNGSSGNVGADSLKYLAAADARFQSCRNPLPASGGTDPETNDQIRRRAPQAFLASPLERAVTMADYEMVTETSPQVDQAVASLRWTGSWYTVFIAVQPKGGGNLSQPRQRSLQRTVERYRLAGQDLLLDSPQYVSLEIELNVCVNTSYFRADVQQSLSQVLGNQLLPNGQKGLFYPDNFTFGQAVYLSPVYAAARSVPGVVSVTAAKFQPQGVNTSQYLDAGEIKLASLQIARLDNDPSYPDHGRLTLNLEGGK